VNARFISKADAICTRDAKKIQDDLDAMNVPQLGALPPTTDDTSGLAQDFGALVTDLRDLGNPPQDDGTFALGVDDWQQALDLLSPGNTQDFTINYMAGVNEFRTLGLKVCTGGSAG
jgi:hypothetical protein